ncbi:hypothetical protein KRX57_05455 [Weeksellaceae bacterium TAE3-ERU29]|nr:hypothetical protein [Weeksellaceae bacterium TAE3-ERU29]
MTRSNKYFFVFFLFINISIFAQENYWKPIKNNYKFNRSARSVSSNAQEFELDEIAFQKALFQPDKTVLFPDAQGNVKKFRITPTHVLSEELEQKYPDIKTYVGTSVDNPEEEVVFSLSNYGLEAIFLNGTNTQYIEKNESTANRYSIRQAKNEGSHIDCGVGENAESIKKELKSSLTARNAYNSVEDEYDDSKVRVYRLAIAGTTAFVESRSAWISASNVDMKKRIAFREVVRTINQVNQIYIADLSIRFKLVTDHTFLNYGEEDPFPKEDKDYRERGFSLTKKKIQKFLDDKIGSDNYDIGHLFHDADVASLADYKVACRPNEKAYGFSCIYNIRDYRKGGLFTVVVAHEIGHQLGAYHTFSNKLDDVLSQVEPGSGSTIMSYAGITDTDDVQYSRDHYFNHVNIQQIKDYMKIYDCAQKEESPNRNAPQIKPFPKDTYIIPKGTAYRLEGEATDTDNDKLYYSWEEADNLLYEENGMKKYALVKRSDFGPNLKVGGMTRVLPPNQNPTRYIPRMSRILEGKLTQSNPQTSSKNSFIENSEWETVSNVARDLNWTFVVRDQPINSGKAGRVRTQKLTLKVVEGAGPFLMTSQSSETTYHAYKPISITWDVAKTNQNPVNAQTVSLYFSKDEGKTFTLVEGNLPNNGAATIKLPNNMVTENGRFMLRADDNIFLAVNTANITITEGTPPVDVTPPKTICSKPSTAQGTALPTKVGITTLNRNTQDNWVGNSKNGFIKMESHTKGFVITRMTETEINKIADPKEGMLTWDKTNQCLKLYKNNQWKCITQGCNE